MNAYLLNRQLGGIQPKSFAVAHTTRLLNALEAAVPDIDFALKPPGNGPLHANATNKAHVAGVNSLTIDPFEGRYLLSGGADSSIAIFDLEAEAVDSGGRLTRLPECHAARTSTTESLGVTHVAFYPFDSLAFTTSGYDHTLKVFSSETLEASASFDLGSIVYSHAVGSHLLVACASQLPAVRLVDLRSGSSTHSLAGHSGAVLAVAWHPRDENILASGAADGSVRLWDIRRSASSLGTLDLDDSIGVAGYDGKGKGARRRERGRAHVGAANGLTWTEDGHHLVSTGHDERMRVWNMATGANTLANFGPRLKNTSNTALIPLLVPRHLSRGREIVYYPNPNEVLGFDLHSGTLINRLRARGTIPRSGLRPRTTSLAWRAHDLEMYSGHTDGSIHCWRPRTAEDLAIERELEEEEEGAGSESTDRKRKRDELSSIVQNLTKPRMTYT